MRKHILQATISMVAMMLVTVGYLGVAQARGPSERESRVERESRAERMEREQPRSFREREPRREARWQEVTGEIENAKKVRLRGTNIDHLVVLLTTDEGRQIVADLGPTKHLKEIQIKPGDEITVRGRIERISDRSVLMAKRVQTDDQAVRIKREMPTIRQPQAEQMQAKRITGQIEMAKELKLHGMDKKHWVVRLKTPDGQKILADLGSPKDLREIQIKTGEQITVHGPMIRLSGKPTLIAQHVRTDTKVAQIDRQILSALPVAIPMPTAMVSEQPSMKTVSGEVLRIERDFYVVKDPAGQEVHLLVSEDIGRGVQVGDKITAQVQPGGQATSIQKIEPELPQSGRTMEPSGRLR